MSDLDNPIVALIGFGLAGLGFGFGLMMGAMVVRFIRRYMKDEV